VKHIFKKLDVGNRTEAALRYVQLFGPSRFDPPEPPAPRGARSEHSARVVGFIQGGRVLVRLDDGRAIEVPLPGVIRNRCEVGSRALIYFEGDGTLMGWYLPDVGIGVDMRNDSRQRRG
jgi:hypothetical protein